MTRLNEEEIERMVNAMRDAARIPDRAVVCIAYYGPRLIDMGISLDRAEAENAVFKRVLDMVATKEENAALRKRVAALEAGRKTTVSVSPDRKACVRDAKLCPASGCDCEPVPNIEAAVAEFRKFLEEAVIMPGIETMIAYKTVTRLVTLGTGRPSSITTQN